jgi:hypothetical protein
VIFLGHGSVEFDKSAHPAVQDGVLIPPDTTLLFYTLDHGYMLTIANQSDYTRFNTRWRDLRPDWKPLPPKYVTYNYKLAPETRPEQTKLGLGVDWGGATPVSLSGGDRYLCEGTPETCPTPALIVAERQGEKISPERWKHHCTGLLGEYQGKNLHWMCCTAIENGAEQEVMTYLTAKSAGHGITNIEASGFALRRPDEQVKVCREFGAMVSELCDTARNTSSDIASADSLVGEARNVFRFAGKNFAGTLNVADLVEAADYLTRARVRDSEAAEKVVRMASEGLKSAVNLAEAVPENATYKTVTHEMHPLMKSVTKLTTDTLKPLAKNLRDAITPAPQRGPAEEPD